MPPPPPPPPFWEAQEGSRVLHNTSQDVWVAAPASENAHSIKTRKEEMMNVSYYSASQPLPIYNLYKCWTSSSTLPVVMNIELSFGADQSQSRMIDFKQDDDLLLPLQVM